MDILSIDCSFPNSFLSFRGTKARFQAPCSGTFLLPRLLKRSLQKERASVRSYNPPFSCYRTQRNPVTFPQFVPTTIAQAPASLFLTPYKNRSFSSEKSVFFSSFTPPFQLGLFAPPHQGRGIPSEQELCRDQPSVTGLFRTRCTNKIVPGTDPPPPRRALYPESLFSIFLSPRSLRRCAYFPPTLLP